MTDSDVAESAPTGDLSGFQRDLLRVIDLLDEPNGRDIVRVLRRQYDAGNDVYNGRLYPNLDTLVGRGLVEKGQRDERANWYRLTEQGRAYAAGLRQWWTEELDTDANADTNTEDDT